MTHLALEYAIQRKIDQQLDDTIIEHARKLINETGVKNNRRMGRAQFTNLQNVTRDTTSVQVILTWIRYQMGRQTAWNERNFGKNLLEYLGPELQSVAEEIVQTLPPSDAEARKVVREIHLRLIRQYVGQLQRLYIGYSEDKS